MTPSQIAVLAVGLVALIVIGIFVWILRDEIRAIGNQFVLIAALFWIIWCFIYSGVWRLRYILRSYVFQSSLLILFFASFYVLIEVIIDTLRDWRILNGWRFFSLFQKVPTPPIWLDFVLLVLAAFLAKHHFAEWRISLKESEVPLVTKEILSELARFRRTKPNPEYADKKKFLEDSLNRIKKLLDPKSKNGIAFSLMEKSPTDNVLTVSLIHPPGAKMDPELKLQIGEGAAGSAYEKKSPIYIPSIKHLVGINMATLKALGVTFKQGYTDERFKSIVCAPILAEAEVIGILNFTSQKRNGFRPLDFKIAELTAAFVSTFY